MGDAEEAEDLGHRAEKGRLKHLISDKRLVDRLQYAVNTLHEVGSRALVFGKLLYMADLSREVEANGGIFNEVAATRLATAFPVDSEQIEEWFDVVSGPLVGRRGRPYSAAKVAHLQRLHTFYASAADRGPGGCIPVAGATRTGGRHPCHQKRPPEVICSTELQGCASSVASPAQGASDASETGWR